MITIMATILSHLTLAILLEQVWHEYPLLVACLTSLELNEGINYGYEPSIDAEYVTSENNGDNWWPSNERLPGYQEHVEHYMSHMLKLGRSLLRMFALGLDLEEHALDYLVTRPYSILKMAHYPGRLSGSDEPSSIRPHTDFELLTILLQDDIPSLEVLSNTGQWIQATPIPGTFVVNIGDSLAMLTNGLFVSTMHRVVNSSKRARYSVPFFLGGRYVLVPFFAIAATDRAIASQDVELKAMDQFITAESPAKFQPINSGDYIRRSLQAVYSKPHIDLNHETIEVQT